MSVLARPGPRQSPTPAVPVGLPTTYPTSVYRFGFNQSFLTCGFETRQLWPGTRFGRKLSWLPPVPLMPPGALVADLTPYVVIEVPVEYPRMADNCQPPKALRTSVFWLVNAGAL